MSSTSINKEVDTVSRIPLITKTEELRKARELKGFSHRDMSKFLGAKSSATYYNIEIGKVEPKISQALQICKLLKEPVQKFFKLKVQE